MSHRVRSADSGRVRTVVLASCVMVATMAGAWSVVLPPGEGPDEPTHLGLVLHLADGQGYPDHDGLYRTVALERLCTTFVASVRVCPRPGETVTATAVRVRGADDAPVEGARPAWDDEGGDRPTAELNQMPQHPPLYYGAMAMVLRGARQVTGGPMSLDRELALLRLVNVLMVVPVPALAWATARRLAADRRSGQAAALLASAVPMLAATAGVVNNDNLLTLLGAAAAPLLAALALGSRRPKTIVTVGVVIGLALLTKAFAIVLLPTLALACWVGSQGQGDDLGVVSRVRRLVGPLGGATLVATVISGWWYLRTWVRVGSPTPSADADRYSAALRPPGFSADVVHFASEFVGRFTERFWGSFGWYSSRFPGVVTVGLTVAAVVLVVVGFAASRRRSGLAVLVLPAALLLLLTASRAWSLHARSGQYPFIQGRYVLTGVVGLAVAAAGGWLRLVPYRWSLRALAGVAVAVQVGGLVRGLTTYWKGGALGRVEALDAWSGLPDGLSTVLVGLALAAAVGLLVVVVRTGVSGESDAGPAGPVGGPPLHGAPVPSASR